MISDLLNRFCVGWHDFWLYGVVGAERPAYEFEARNSSGAILFRFKGRVGEPFEATQARFYRVYGRSLNPGDTICVDDMDKFIGATRSNASNEVRL